MEQQLQQVLQQLAALQNEVTRLTSENQQLTQSLAANVDVATVAGRSAAAAVAPAVTQLQQLVQVLTAQARVSNEQSRPSLLDGKTVGKPQTFKGDEARFPEFTKKLEDYLFGIEPRLEEVLEWALDQEAEITTQAVEGRFGDDLSDSHVPHIGVLNQQLKTNQFFSGHSCLGQPRESLSSCKPGT